MKMIRNELLLAVMVFVVSGCGLIPSGAYTNKQNIAPSGQTSFVLRDQRVAENCTDQQVVDPKKQKNVLVLLALSGGGSRAAYFAALSMLEMQRTKLKIGDSESDVLHEVDAISSVSGGSLAGAYYAISNDPGEDCASYSKRTWDVSDDSAIRDLMTRDYRGRWLANWFWPTNIVKFWSTKYDRTDIMAQTLADNLFDRKLIGFDLGLGQLNELRPNLILNSTLGSLDDDGGIKFGEVFTFTSEDFSHICSSVEDYSVARGVMATATFPGVFNFMTLRDYCWDKKTSGNKGKRYVHVFDGGNADNLGLTSIKRVIWTALQNRDDEPILPYDAVIVIQVDAFINSRGADPGDADPRGFFDFVMDTNFIDATDSLLGANRKNLLSEFEGHRIFPFGNTQEDHRNNGCEKFFHGDDIKYCDMSTAYWDKLNQQIGGKLTFVHLSFDKVGNVKGCKARNGDSVTPDCLFQQLEQIGTDFKFKRKKDSNTGLSDADALACAVPLLFGRVDPEFCGEIVPTPSPELESKWEEVKAILERTYSEDGKDADLRR